MNVDATAQAADKTVTTVPTLSDVLLNRAAPPDFEFSPQGDAVVFVDQLPLRETLNQGAWPVSELRFAMAPDWHVSTIYGNDRLRSLSTPRWSGDGRRVLFVQSDGSGFQIVVWNRATHHVQYSSRCFRTPLDMERPLPSIGTSPQWTDNTHILVPIGPELCPPDRALSVIASATPGGPSILRRVQGWEGAGNARSSTAVTLDSGVPGDSLQFGQTNLLLIDVRTGHQRVVTRTSVQELYVSPDDSALAIVHRVDIDLPTEREAWLPRYSRYRYGLSILSIYGTSVGVPVQLSRPILPFSFRWSPTGERFAVAEFDWDSGGDACVEAFGRREGARVARVCGDIGTGAALVPAGNNLMRQHPAENAIAWAANMLLVRMRSSTWNDVQRYDWYSVSDDGRRVPLTTAFTSVPDSLYAGLGGRIFTLFGRGAQQLRVTDNAGGPRVVDVSSDSGTKLLQTPGSPYTHDWAVAILPQDSKFEIACTSLVTLVRSRPLVVPRPMAINKVRCSHAGPEIVYHMSDDSTGEQQWVLSELADGGRPHILESTRRPANPLAFTLRSFTYTSLKGDTLQAQLTLPSSRPKGPLPTIVWVYLGQSISAIRDSVMFPLSADGAGCGCSPTALAAHGFAVVQPSMPYDDDYRSSVQPADVILDGVMPAIDQAVRLGFADSSRIGIIGHSFGGFSVFLLLTRTSRFKAAVALDGITNWAAIYGRLAPQYRYDQSGPYDDFNALTWPQAHLHAAPWERPNDYLRNSPLFSASAITTPLLIIHGDQDFVPDDQAEQMYETLFRLGRRVEFVRYLGEGHIIQDYYNVVDVDQRIGRWFGHYLASGDSSNVHLGRRP
jgi:pimeloyl-ACP methyl ester carboxylesterase